MIHALSLAVPIVVELTSRNITVALLLAVTAVFMVSELVRLKGRRVPFITHFTLRMSQPEEQKRFTIRPVYLAIGIVVALLIFPKSIAFASIAIVGVGDPVASFVGRKIGRLHVGRKTLEGFVGGLIASSLIASLLVSPIVAFIGSVAAMCLELLDIVDDNLTMPIGAGAVMLLLTSL
jgi:dolichol kinase